MASFGWTCRTCTYFHHAPGERCVMCGTMKISKQEMRDFVKGIPIPNADAHQNVAVVEIAQVSCLKQKPLSFVVNPYEKHKRSSKFVQNAEILNSLPREEAHGESLDEPFPISKKVVSFHTSRIEPLPFVNIPSVCDPQVVTHSSPPPDEQACQHWLYPIHENFEPRKYQIEITETALLHNTLVSLPTGLGKTLIAAVVLYNFHRWFPSGIVIFCAPTLPLVHQQVQACGSIVNLPAQETAVLTGQLSPSSRQDLWTSRRVFFCTPQTVQKDLESGICKGDNVVALILDEVHKASGDYAYVKVVELLDRARAKYRIVGLSATPGVNIKAIQRVVEALRIAKIEARSENDSSVAPYTYNRINEIVLVPQASIAKEVEQALSDLVRPYLEKIQSAIAGTEDSVFARRLSCINTLTAYQVMISGNELQSRNPDLFQRLQGNFHVAQYFVQLLGYLSQQGVGMVQAKIQSLRSERPKGLMATVVKEAPFQKLYDVIMKASILDRLPTNPKLSKLCEILEEHFERAKACAAVCGDESTSTRAIVFSQFRESVSEIVLVLKSLEPTIRSRHFIGQGKGSKHQEQLQNCAVGNSNSDSLTGLHAINSSLILKGMKQSEQQQVIREFRQGVYNTLVCTCIGEEGLDIGEVDLIINFDMLRNPIRMIQRVGRTGRKREGRVVFLVNEGSEEQKLHASRQSEHTLHHALKNPKSFQCHNSVPLLPIVPQRKDWHIRQSQVFHVSQVEGHNSTRRNINRNKTKKWEEWRLSEAHDTQRQLWFGELSNLCFNSRETGPGFRRFFLSVWRQSSSKSFSSSKVDPGRSIRLLQKLELSYASSTTIFGSKQNQTDCLRALRTHRACPEINRIFYRFATLDSDPACEFPRTMQNLKANMSRLKEDQTLLNTSNKVVSDEQGAHESVNLASECSLERDKHDFFGKSDGRTSNEVNIEDDLRLLSADDASTSSDEDNLQEYTHYCSSNDTNNNTEGENAMRVLEAINTEDECSMIMDSPECARELLNDTVPSENRQVGVSRMEDGLVIPLPLDDLRLPSDDSSAYSDDEGHDCAILDDVSSAQKTVRFEADDPICKSSPESVQLVSTPSIGRNECVVAGFPSKLHRKTNGHNYAMATASVLQDTQQSSERLSLNILVDTPVDTDQGNQDVDCGIVCEICHSGASPELDPIILCDGPADGVTCDHAVHLSCYSLPADVLTLHTWRCDACSFNFNGGTHRIKCHVCDREKGGILKRLQSGLWTHMECRAHADRKKRLRKKNKVPVIKKQKQAVLRRPLDDVSPNEPENTTVRAQSKSSNRSGMGRIHDFLELEAAVDSDDDMDGDDEDDLAALEEDEAFMSSFINDSSQLGYTQDDLDRVDPDTCENGRVFDNATTYRACAMERERNEMFATPTLNRWTLKRKHQKLHERSSRSVDEDTPESLASSEKGLGRMHFIRSVLEHHRKGGREEEIEEALRSIQEDVQNKDEYETRPVPRQLARAVPFEASETDSDC